MNKTDREIELLKKNLRECAIENRHLKSKLKILNLVIKGQKDTITDHEDIIEHLRHRVYGKN